jgi:hypothetical protein
MPIIGPVRFSYMNLFKSRFNELNKKDQYDVLVMIPKVANEFCPNTQATLKTVADTIKTLANEKWGERLKTEGFKWNRLLRDGDKDLDDEGLPREPGCWIFRASQSIEYPPPLINGNGDVVTGGWQSGDWGRIKLAFFTYENAGNRGVSSGIRGVQFLYKGEPLGSSSDPQAVAAEFGKVEGAHIATKPAVAAGAATSEYGEPSNEDDPFKD